MSEFVIDFSDLSQLAMMTPLESFWFVFVRGGWAIILWGFLWGLWKYWVFYLQNAFADAQKWVLLAIDVPKNNEMGPLAVENIFSHLAGAHGTDTLYEKYWEGKHQQCFSLEIVSIDGYVQFILRTLVKYRDLAEAAIYAQYPDAEITEIEDYVHDVPQRWPHNEYQFFGLEYKLSKPEAYPIRTWPEFEDKLVGEFRDPMAALLEVMSKIGPGEQIWLQYVILPIDDSWQKKGLQLVNKLISREEEKKETIFGMIVGVPFALFSVALSFVHDVFFGLAEGMEKKKEREYPTMMMHMTPGEKDIVAAIERKISKIGFRTKCRIMYVARNEVYNVRRGMYSTVGALKQYNSIHLNRFSVQKKIWTKVYYMFTKYRLKERQNKIMRAYRVRSDARGAGPGFVLNIEELASLWHFPVIQVKAPMVKKTEAKKAEPPFSLPVSIPRVFTKKEKRTETLTEIPKDEERIKELSESRAPREENVAPIVVTKKESPPENLPIV